MLLDFLFPAAAQPISKDDIPVVRHHETAAELQARGIEHLDELWAACSYHHKSVQRLIHLYKYRRFSHLHKPLFQCIVKASFPQVHNAVLCPVPLHWTRLFWRGFNQSELLAKEILHYYQLPMQLLLKRKRPTGHQAHRTREQRLQTMKNIFTCSQKVDANTVILVDDVVTTGATLDACARTLKSAGAQRVLAWTVAFD